MNQLRSPTYLNYSKIPSIPIFGSLFYVLQNSLYTRDVINTLYVSRKETKLQNAVLKLLSKNSSLVISKSFKFGRLLKRLKPQIVLDVTVKNFKNLDQKELYDLTWSLVFASSVTQKTKIALKKFLPENFPVKNTIVIPYNDSFDVVCDYIFQTAKVLANKGNIVYLIALANPTSLPKYLFKKRKENSKRYDFFEKNKIIVINPLTLFPLRLMKLKVIESINKRLTRMLSSFFIKRTCADYLWCFDPTDIDLVRLVNGHTSTIYDCVDYFSTLDPKLDEEIKAKETQLIKAVDYFFVNSNALKETKKRIRKPDAVVPQGFDFDAFETKRKLSSTEKKELRIMKRLFNKISKPQVGFVGNITYRMDFALLRSLAQRIPNVSFVFTDAFLPMPADDKYRDTKRLIQKFKSLKNVYLVPRTKSRLVIKKVIKNFDIGIIPYDVSFDFNRYCYPMKLFEYFYMGIPVISTSIDELKRFPKYVKIGKGVKEWEKHIQDFLSNPWPVSYRGGAKKVS